MRPIFCKFSLLQLPILLKSALFLQDDARPSSLSVASEKIIYAGICLFL